MKEIDFQSLMAFAQEARKNSYAPYSEFRVGAALLAESGKVYLGCNVENASFGATCCAERTALFAAVAAGERRFTALALIGGKDEHGDDGVFPCGICRQALAEFCSPNLPIAVKKESGFEIFTLSDILPKAFTAEAL